MVREHPCPRFLLLNALYALGVSISVIRNEVVIGPHENGFPGPAVALDRPNYYYSSSWK